MQALRLLVRSSVCRSVRLPLTTNRPTNVTRKLVTTANLYAQHFQKVKLIKVATTRSMSSTPIYTVDYLSSKIQKELQAEHVDIEDLSNCGCGMKFDAVIVSPQFEGKPILQRQRLVNQILVEEMKHIHAFTMRTLTPSQWKENQAKQEQGKA